MDAPTTLQEAILFFSNYDNCHAAVLAVRWPHGVVRCPTCGSEHVTYLANARRWKCYEKHPRGQFSLKVGTIFEDSPIGLEKWLPALWLLTNCKNGISSYELARHLGVTQKTAWFMLSRLRLALQGDSGGKLNGEVEADETYIGGKARYMHAAKRKRVQVKRGRSIAGKVAVMGLLERHPERGSSRVRLNVLNSLKRGHIQSHVRSAVQPGATIHTDALASYDGLSTDYTHQVIDHAEAYVDGNVHTNGMKNFWSLLKRAIKGTYVEHRTVPSLPLPRRASVPVQRAQTDRPPPVSSLASLESFISASPTPLSSGPESRKRAEKSYPQIPRGRRRAR